MRKYLWISALLFAAVAAPNAHADSTYIITLDVLSESSPAPVVTFNQATLLGSGPLAGWMEFTFSPDIGFSYPEAIPSFPQANTQPIYLCEGCCGNVVNSPDCEGVVEFDNPGNTSIGGPDAEIIGGFCGVDNGVACYSYAFTPLPNYYVYGQLELTPVPESGSGVFLLAG
jgi:hypothetical protein